MNVTNFLWHHRKAVLTLVVLCCLAGGYFATRLPVAIFPQLVIPRIAISADAGDIPIETTLVQVTRPIEAVVSSVPGVTKVQSTTTRGSASLDVTFGWDTDMQLALQRVQSQLAEARGALPADSNLTAAIINPSIFPIMGVSLTSNGTDLAALRKLAIYSLRPQLARLPGVAQVRITGGDVPEYVVSVRPEALAARGLSLQDVQDALAKANSISSVGHFTRSYQNYDILVSGLLRNADDLKSVTVATKNGVPIAIASLAIVTKSVAPPAILATGNGKPAVVVNIVKQPEANTVQVAEEVRAALPGLMRSLPPGINNDLFYDQSEIVKSSEVSVVESIVIGGVLALFVLMAFLGNIRAASVVLLILPLSITITFGLMKLLGETLNIMTLGALAIALGLVIDDGIVVVESIFHHLEQGEARREAIAAGLHSMTPAMVGSSITTMVAFLPLTFLSGVTGQFFAPLALVMIATLTVSLLLSLFLTPVIGMYLLPRGGLKSAHGAGKPGLLVRIMNGVTNVYGRFLTWCLRHRPVVLVLLIPVAVGAYLLFNRLETGFFPEFDEGAFVIDYKMPPGTSLAETNRVAGNVEAILGKTPEVASWSRLTGAMSGSGMELTQANEGDILVRLKANRTAPGDEVMSDIRKQIESEYPAFSAEFIQMLQDGIGDMAGSPSPIEVKIYGDDTKVLTQLAHDAGDIVSKTPGVVEENDGIVESGPEMLVHVDSEKASRYGLTTDAVTSAATTALKGAIATTVRQGEEGVDVRVQARRSLAGVDPDRLPDIPLAAPALAGGDPSGGVSATVPLRSIADLAIQPGTPQIRRENLRQMVSVTARLEGRDLGSGVRDVQSRIAKNLALPPGYRIEFGGLYASQQESFAQLVFVLLVAVLLVSTLLLIQFRSFRQTFALLAAAVLSLVGVFLGLFLTKTPLNISSLTGAVMIIGIVTENGIVLFDKLNRLRKDSPRKPVLDLMAEAGRLRLRPILMTTIGAILALLPLALGLGAGAAMQKPLAIAVIGGLSVSMIFTLIVAPVLFVTLESWTESHPDTHMADE